LRCRPAYANGGNECQGVIATLPPLMRRDEIQVTRW
jgi:hypothetical protein